MRPLPPAFLGPAIAHRGLHDAAAGVIENSRAAVAAAVAAGYGAEIDVQLSADGEAMVFHDATLDRLTDASGPVAALPTAALARLRLAGRAEPIPTLAEILALVAGRAPLLVEVKDRDGAMGPAVGPLEERVAALLAAYRGPVAAMSFNPHAVARLRVAAPHLACGVVAGPPRVYPGLAPARARVLARLAEGAFDFVSYHHAALPTPETARLRAERVPVLCWTVGSAEDEAAARPHADNVTFEGYRPRAVAQPKGDHARPRRPGVER